MILTVVAQDMGGRPLPGVHFKARHALDEHSPAFSGLTGEGGKGQLRLPSGWYSVGARGVGYQSFVDTDVRLGRDHPATVTMTLQPGGTVSGRVVDAFGAPVVGARLAWVPEDETAPRLTAVSGKDARFSFEGVGLGRGVLLTERPDFIRDRRVFESLPRELAVTLTASGKVRVRGQAPDGRPVNLYDAELERIDAGDDSWSRVSADGVVRYEGLGPGRYRVTTSYAPWPSTWWTAASEFTVLPGQAQEVALSFAGFKEREALHGRVVGPDDRPLSGVQLLAESGEVKEGVPRSLTRAVTDAQGRFAMEHLLQGPQRMKLSGSQQAVEVATDAQDVSLTFRASTTVEGVIEGRVLAPDGRPVSRFKVGATTFENPEGRFSFPNFGPPPLEMNFEARHFAPLRRVVETLQSPRTVLPDIVLDRGRTVRGQVLGVDGKPVASGIEVYFVLTRELSRPSAQGRRAGALTDASGRFVMAHVPREAGALFLDANAGAAMQPLGAEQETVTLRLVPDARVQGMVADAEGRPLEGYQWRFRCQGPFVSQSTADAEGRFTLGAPAGQECVLKASEGRGSSNWPRPPRRVFFPRRFVGAPGETLRMELWARTGPASLRVTLPRASEWYDVVLAQGDVPLPATALEMDALVLSGIDPDVDVSERRPERLEPGIIQSGSDVFVFSSLPLGRYTLFVTEDLVGRSVQRIPLEIAKPGVHDTASKLPGDGGAYFAR
ncbi:carboxypeptidase-like regulatory domain-containing protein [Corallococcus sp. BB11-1]|uniref:MSCRAMM family protein n=1 Tax=Corallococcus sp. BB11-1 TaxID=2996783 RepID=UPI00227115F3|nr:carboxypeptidase-like regulatory domain-containing protein [Corallococcus sp. BB11-1]MCY1033792.1 carboxypeptidase-like regulatory domain-containing protein [Corallococcus sp. BB11-1]